MHIINFKGLSVLGLVCALLFTGVRGRPQQTPTLEPIRVGVFSDLSGLTVWSPTLSQLWDMTH